MKTLLEALQLVGATSGAILDRLHVGVAVADSCTGTIILANEEFARITGYPLELLLSGKFTFVDLTHPDDQEISIQLERRLLAGETDQYSLSKRYVRPDGGLVWVNLSVLAIQRSSDATLSIAVVIDVTKNRVFETKADATEMMARLATWNWSADTNTTNVSPAYNALYGLPKDTPAPTFDEAKNRIHPDDRQRFRKTVLKGWTNRSHATGEFRIIRRDGQVRWVRVTTICFWGRDGKPANLVGATVDITDSKTSSLQNISDLTRVIQGSIEKRWDKPLSVSSLAREHGVSVRSIYRSFFDRGTTPKSFQKKVRLMHARARILARKKATITEIALQCGFSNLGHFARDYRREFGESPSETRKKN